MTHPVIKDLTRRYATKRYDATRRIAPRDMEVIKEALRLTPSSVNSQPWKFIIIESDEAKQRLHATFARKFQMNQKHALEASHIILFAYNPCFTRENYKRVVDVEVASGHLPADKYDEMMDKGFFFAQMNMDETGCNGHWTRAQTYLALGNALHTAARLGIDATPMEGVDKDLIGEVFRKELGGYVCEVALALGYHLEGQDYNQGLPKARLPLEDVVTVI
ncbi:nitroreductase family protein [Desulfoplanes formicivorans]|uniref:NAD(P)H-dependent oxidoreductase n=1 Tax=Desulfoplanes formicivorans TaxID=1592317 RepID=A0A194AL73_9BACT|nr:nitroreductase family protein [Desulfoplanes formicivorans]GAU09429.1 NAD(P)H-dependent oxidoreductase [Desulfoplanes formicivorans]